MNDLQKFEQALQASAKKEKACPPTNIQWQNDLMRHIRKIGPLNQKPQNDEKKDLNILLWRFAAGSFSFAAIAVLYSSVYGWNIAGYLYANLFFDGFALMLVR